MDLYYKDISPPARAVYATIKHLDLSVNLKEIEVMSGETHSEEFLKINPAHQVPTLVDNGLVLGESRAIMAYLVNKYAPNHAIYPADPTKRAQVDRMLYFDGTNLFPALKATYSCRFRYNKEPSEEQMQDGRNAISELIALKGINKFLAGDHATLADISVAMPFSFMRMIFPEESKSLEHWYSDVEAAIPAVKEINDALDLSPFIELFKM